MAKIQTNVVYYFFNQDLAMVRFFSNASNFRSWNKVKTLLGVMCSTPGALFYLLILLSSFFLST